MVKHRFRESLKSYFGSHVDPEKEQQLIGAKTDVEHKVQEILKLIKEENSEEDGTRVQNSKEPLGELIHDFHQQYQALYSRYDHLTSKLRKKIHGKLKKESSSSSSDSDSGSENSSKDTASNNGLQSEFQKINEDIKQELERARLEVADLNTKFAIATEEREALNQCVESLREEQKHMEVMCMKNENLVMELRTTVEQLKDEKFDIIKELEAAREEISITKRMLENAEQQVTLISHNLKATEEEKDSLKLKHEQMSIEVQQAHNRIEELIAASNQQTEKLGERQNEVAAITEMHEVYKNESSAQLKSLAEQVTSLEMEIRSLQEEKVNMEALIERKTSEAKDLEEYNQGLKDRNAEHEVYKNESSAQLKSLAEQVTSLEMEIRSLQEEKENMEALIERKTSEAKDLEEYNQGLKDRNAEHEVYKNESSAQLKSLAEQVTSIGMEIRSLQAEKESMEAVIERKTREAKDLEEYNQGLKDRNAELEMIAKERESELSALMKKLEENENESLSRIRDLTEQMNNLLTDTDSLRSLKSEMEEQLIRQNNEASTQIESVMSQIHELKNEVESLLQQKTQLEVQLELRTSETSQYLIQMQKLKEELASRTLDHQRVLEEKQNSTLHLSNLEQEMVSICNQKSEIEEQVTAKTLEINKLQEENSRLQEKIEDMEIILSERQAELVSLHNQLAESLQLCERLKMELESMKKDKSEVEEHIEAKAQENGCLAEEKLMLQQKMAEMDNIITEKEVQLVTLRDELGKKEDVTSSQVKALTEQASSLQEELMSLQKQNGELVLQCQSVKEEYAGKMTTIENEKDEWKSRSSDYQTKLTDREEAFQNLMEDYKQIERQFQECKMNLIVAETKTDELEKEYHKEFEQKHHIVADLEQNVEELKRDLEEKADEISTMTEKVRTIEVKLRLSNQKLRVTEQLLSETEESFKSRELILLEEKKELEDMITSLSQRIAVHTKAYQKMITDISDTIDNMLTNQENAVEKFIDDYTCCKNRILEISNELHIAKNWIQKMNREKDQLKYVVYCLEEQLRGKNEQESVLKEKAEMLEKKAISEESEKENLTRAVNQLQKTVGELENVMKKQDSVIVDLGEEKREAIRQLCMWVDYHRYRYDYLKEILSNRNSGGMRAG